MLNRYEKLIKRCISLAKKGEGRVSPNPLVGCVIFDDDFRIISEGYHKKYGENHAERNAILNSKEDVRGMNLAVNLEPCSHFGKTPPCADLIIERGIKKVIVGMQDPNPIVSGRGIEKLKKAGIEVITGILEPECRKLNEVFIKNQTENMPFVVIKTATTIDGKIASRTGDSKWITDETSRKEVQKLRNRYDAILTSSSTVIADNPFMTCRIKNGRNPVRVVIDRELKTLPESNIYNNDAKVYLITAKEKIKVYPKNVEIIKCHVNEGFIDLKEALNLLYERGIRSILVEAGGKLNNSFIQSGNCDKLIWFVAPKIFADSSGKNFVYGQDRQRISECNNLSITSVKRLKNDIMIIGEFKTAKHEYGNNDRRFN